MHNSFLASSLTCHILQPANTYFYFSYSRNNPALSGSNSFSEEKQPCQDLVVCAGLETSRFPFTAQLHRLWKLGLSQSPVPTDLQPGMINTQLPVARAIGIIDGHISNRVRQSQHKSLIQLLIC